ncbi:MULTISPECIES: MerR family transcriptional regulator [Tsukamurella]|uniref:MerR family transcriptional regulator n=2 Tax=Tsukamurella TaxID=2060 RepID=A0A5C5S2B2_9ACTN|nr:MULTISPECIES: MerR family transcriptional regulator [Tsukamurella]NMD57625.1 MerR family transcriptional regulator [Tsukamurella columbiensis]TWS29042.1 MerR family transcriptional regulator [Tsukamurella conjunctivitidis]
MKIGELSRRTGVSVRSLRYYEEQGLLAPDRTAGGHRDYPEEAVDRVILVQQLFAAGLHSPRIARLLPCMRAPEGDPNERATAELAEQLIAERKRIDGAITDLVRSRTLLDDIIAGAVEPDQETIETNAARA